MRIRDPRDWNRPIEVPVARGMSTPEATETTTDVEATVDRVLDETSTWAVVGLSTNTARAAYGVALRVRGHPDDGPGAGLVEDAVEGGLDVGGGRVGH